MKHYHVIRTLNSPNCHDMDSLPHDYSLLGPIWSKEYGECLSQWKSNSLNVVTQMTTFHIHEYGIPTISRAKSDFLGGIFRILAF